MEYKDYNALPDILDPTEAAAYLHMSRQFIYTAVRSGQLPARKLGNKIRIRKVDLIRLMDGENEEN